MDWRQGVSGAVKHLIDDQVILVVESCCCSRNILSVELRHLELLVVGTLILLHEDLHRHLLDKIQRLSSLVTHQTDRALVNDAVQCHQVIVFHLLVTEVVSQVLFDLHFLLIHVREVNEEARTHVALHRSDVDVFGGRVVPYEQVAVLEESTASDLLRATCGDQLLVQVSQSDIEIAVYALGDHCRVEMFAHLFLRDSVESQQAVENDLERIDTELELSLHVINEFQFNVTPPVVRQGDETPAIVLRADFHHLLDVRLLQTAAAHAFVVDSVREEIHERVEDGRLHFVEVALTAEVDAEYQVEIVIHLAVFATKNVTGGAAV